MSRKKPPPKRWTYQNPKWASNVRAREDIARLKAIVPSLKKFSRRKVFTEQEKRTIKRFSNMLPYSDNLHPVTKNIAKKYRDELYTPKEDDPHTYGVQAIKLTHLPREKYPIKIKDRHGHLEYVVQYPDGQREWWHSPISKITKQTLKKTARTAFEDNPYLLPLQDLAEQAARYFKNTQTKAVSLWTVDGIVGRTFRTFGEFELWLYREWEHYKDVNKWINGIAILV